jgi:DHA1 family multidrug resistance protein-like MFS transporter
MRKGQQQAKPSWQRNLAVLWLGELIAISGFSVALPFLPYYVQELGITDLNQVAFWAGLLTTAQAVTMAVVAPVWGVVADRYGRKLMLERAMFGGAVVLAAMGLTRNVYQLTVLRAIQGMLTGTVPAAMTLVASGTPIDRRGYALGMLQMSVYLGSSVGPLLGGLIADQMGYRATFFVTGSLLLIAGLLVTALVREEITPSQKTRRTEGAGKPKPRVAFWEGLVKVLHTGPLMTVFVIRVLGRTAPAIIGPFLPLFIQGIAAPGAKIASITGIISGVMSATSAVAAMALGRLSDRVGGRRVLLACAVTDCVLYAIQPWSRNPTQFLILRAVAGVTAGGTLASVNALMAACAPKDCFGAVYGLDTSVGSAANAIAPMVGAALTTGWGLPAAFYGAVAMFGLSAAVTAFTARSRRQERKVDLPDSR